jgi:hypothetical protein
LFSLGLVRAALIVIVLATMGPCGSDAMSVDGVPVYGRVHDVSAHDIREAIKEHGDEPAVRVDVVSRSEMHIYYRSRELGWTPSSHHQAVRGSPRLAWSSGWVDVTLRPDILNFIRTAHEVYIFPIRFTRLSSPADQGYWSVPHRDGKHLRLLDGEARRQIVRLLSGEANWFHGFNDFVLIGDEPRNVGLEFRNGAERLTLFFSSGGRMEGSFKGEHTGGSLEQRQQKQMEKWKTNYAQAELAVR